MNAPNRVDISSLDRHFYNGLTYNRVRRRAHYVHDALYRTILAELSNQSHLQPTIVQLNGPFGVNFHAFRKGTITYVEYQRSDTDELYMTGYATFLNHIQIFLQAIPPGPNDV